MKSQTIIFLSNGYAEDNIASCIIENLLQKDTALEIKVLPFVGEGAPYRKLKIKVLGPCKKMPSDGFIASNFFYFLKDLKAGWLKMYAGKVRSLKKESKKVRLVVCVGDIFLVLSSALFLRKPLIFIATAKSDYIKEHYLLEKWLMRRCCKLVFARDKKTALSLRRYRINAVYVGNAMMDCLKITGEDFGVREGSTVVGIVPGSRKEAYENLKVSLSAAEKIYLEGGKNFLFLLALAPSLDARKIPSFLQEKKNWTVKDVTFQEKKKGIVLHLVSKEGTLVKVVQGRFGDVVNLSRVVIGTAGMANEQAVGLGKPVVAFPGKGPQITEKFLRAQQKLLGGCVFIVKRNPQAIASRVLSIVKNYDELVRVAKVGKERMGEPGAASRMAELIYAELK